MIVPPNLLDDAPFGIYGVAAPHQRSHIYRCKGHSFAVRLAGNCLKYRQKYPKVTHSKNAECVPATLRMILLFALAT